MRTWLDKVARSDRIRIESNIRRLENLKKRVHALGYFALASQSGGYRALQELLEDKIVLGREDIHKKLQSALIGENNQKIALDAPQRFQGLMDETEKLINIEIGKEEIALRKLDDRFQK